MIELIYTFSIHKFRANNTQDNMNEVFSHAES